jgi:hypothetical protein
MRLLMIYADRFYYKTAVKNLETASEQYEQKEIEKALIGFVHMEAADEENTSAIETKVVKNLKWAARKNDTQVIVIHSFAHLAETKASPNATKQLLENTEKRLGEAGYKTYQTPFGYFLDLDIKAPGHSFSRLFKEIT